MGDEQDAKEAFPLAAQLRDAGIPDEALSRAASTARRLCEGARPLEGGPLDPCNGFEYQQLFASLAARASQ